jgi:hypothetical protein
MLVARTKKIIMSVHALAPNGANATDIESNRLSQGLSQGNRKVSVIGICDEFGGLLSL